MLVKSEHIFSKYFPVSTGTIFAQKILAFVFVEFWRIFIFAVILHFEDHWKFVDSGSQL